jgi:hypothetical protein
MRRHPRRLTQADYQAIRDGFEAAGLDRDYLHGEDIEDLWRRGCAIADIVAAAKAYAQRSGITTEAEL